MKFVTLIIVGCFCVLTAYAYGQAAVLTPHSRHTAAPVELRKPFGYDLKDRAVMIKAMTTKPTNNDRTAALKQKQAKVLAEVYGITPANAGSYLEWW